MKTINASKCTLVQFEPASCLQKFAIETGTASNDDNKGGWSLVKVLPKRIRIGMDDD